MTAVNQATEQRGSVFRTITSSPLLRGTTIAMFLSGLGTAAVAPQIAMYLVTQLDASLTVAGLYYLTNLTAPIAGYLIGRSSALGGLIGGLGVSAVGLPLVFLAPSLLALLAAGGLAIMSRTSHGIR